jgi:carboxyl-terminal processing protease
MVVLEVPSMTNPGRFLPLVFLVAVGSHSPSQVQAQAANEDDVSASIRKFSEVYGAIEANFADKIDPDNVVYRGAIPGMLRTLDPHSAFYDPKSWQLMREGQAGHYYGVGMLIGAPLNQVVVMHPFEGSPAYRAGIRPGDQIIEVNDQKITKPDTSIVSGLLKGPRGTTAIIKVRRVGSAEPLTFTVVRDNVPRDSVNYAFWLQPGIAYMKIEAFNETTSHEVDRALAKFGESSIEGLILDLRNNPGGLVNEAVNVADRFLHKGQTIVSHHGRASSETKFVARKGERGPEYPIVVLVNRGTASAAEILSGALQDHDRAVILGENTFGKGLVQAPFPITGNGALMLTIAKYYTPSGRLIQRDYEHRSFYEYYSRNEGHGDEKDMRKTDGGRTVFGGDGISPDQHYLDPKLNKLQRQLLGRLTFFFYSPEYFAKHPAQMEKSWKPDAALIDDFKAYALEHKVEFTPQEWNHDRDWIADRLREELFITAFSKEQSDRLVLETDPEVKKGVEALPSSKALLEKAKETLAKQARAGDTVIR